MKRVLVFLYMLALVFTSTYAQEAEAHLKFKGIAITGRIENVVEKLKAEGYKLSSQSDDYAIMTGNFANSACSFFISATPQSKQVYTVIVVYDEANSWSTLKSDYLNLKKLLTQKYQVTPRSSENFVSPYYEGDGYELQATKNSKCFYYSIYDVPHGEIRLVILNKRINIMYTDSLGNLTNEREEKADALDDL